MARQKAAPKPIYTLDAETDPFLYGRKPEVFCWGVYRGWFCRGELQKDVDGIFQEFWGDGCTEKMHEYLYTLEPGIIYAHNGGRFDIFYLLKYIKKIGRIVNNRILSCYIECAGGMHEVRDSFKIFPAALSEYAKDEIHYSKLEGRVCYEIGTRKEWVIRELYKEEIISYLKTDCKRLFEICHEFRQEYGNHLTVGSCAIKQLRKFHDIGEALEWDEDRDIRARYFYGGRVQYFKRGIITGNLTYVDVNSMYPYVMANYQHPIGHPSTENRRVISDKTFFVTVEGLNHGAFPCRMRNGGIEFTVKHGVFHVSIHEYNEATRLGWFETHNILRTVDFENSTNFAEFVQHFYALRQTATESMNRAVKNTQEYYAMKLQKDFNKNLLNNSYGRFALNPDNQWDYDITDLHANKYGYIDGVLCRGNCEIIDDNGERSFACGGWHESELWNFEVMLWKRPSANARVLNVAVGASITGAARSYLMQFLSMVEEPLYCDTDSIIFSTARTANFDHLPLHDSRLGALKVEDTGTEVHIGNKKQYAFYGKKKGIKIASKGGRLNADDIRRIVLGGVVEKESDAPTFSLSGEASFLKRRFQRTEPCREPRLPIE